MPGNIDQSYTSRFQGESIPIDLPGGRTVFALLDLRAPNNEPLQDIQGRLPEIALTRRFYPEGQFPPAVGTSRIRRIEFLDKRARNKIKLNCDPDPFPGECPLLVSFRQPFDPTSVFAIDPDNMTASLGGGYSLRGIYLQITDDEPTHQLGKRLVWEKIVDGKHLDGSDVNRPTTLASRLTILSFKRWK